MTDAHASLDELAASLDTTVKPLIDVLETAGLATTDGHPSIDARTRGYGAAVVCAGRVVYRWNIQRTLPLLATALAQPLPTPARIAEVLESLRAHPSMRRSWERPGRLDEF